MIVDAGDNDAQIPVFVFFFRFVFCFVFSCAHTRTHTQNPVKSGGKETKHSRKIAVNWTRYSQLSTN